MDSERRGYALRVGLVFLLLMAVYLALAWWVYAPRGYYGEVTGQPRFADPWFARAETILEGGVLYRDVFTTTPPLTNYLLLAPSLAARAAGYLNPWTTLAFMVFFALFCLGTAWALLWVGATPREGYHAALMFLLNPLTLGNAVLRRQDESILTFFSALALVLVLRKKTVAAALAMGGAILIKLGGLFLVPLACLHAHRLRAVAIYAVLPVFVAFLAFAPFLALAGKQAMIWRTEQKGNEHPFQFGGVSLSRLWNIRERALERQARREGREWRRRNITIEQAFCVLLVGSALALALVLWRRYGLLQDATILLSVGLMFSPKLHAGYFSLLAFTLAPLARSWVSRLLLFLFGFTVLTADFCHYPLRNPDLAFRLMVDAALLLAMIVPLVVWESRRASGAATGRVYNSGAV